MFQNKEETIMNRKQCEDAMSIVKTIAYGTLAVVNVIDIGNNIRRQLRPRKHCHYNDKETNAKKNIR
jgi:hypothetical protein